MLKTDHVRNEFINRDLEENNMLISHCHCIVFHTFVSKGFSDMTQRKEKFCIRAMHVTGVSFQDVMIIIIIMS